MGAACAADSDRPRQTEREGRHRVRRPAVADPGLRRRRVQGRRHPGRGEPRGRFAGLRGQGDPGRAPPPGHDLRLLLARHQGPALQHADARAADGARLLAGRLRDDRRRRRPAADLLRPSRRLRRDDRGRLVPRSPAGDARPAEPVLLHPARLRVSGPGRGRIPPRDDRRRDLRTGRRRRATDHRRRRLRQRLARLPGDSRLARGGRD